MIVVAVLAVVCGIGTFAHRMKTLRSIYQAREAQWRQKWIAKDAQARADPQYAEVRRRRDSGDVRIERLPKPLREWFLNAMHEQSYDYKMMMKYRAAAAAPWVSVPEDQAIGPLYFH